MGGWVAGGRGTRPPPQGLPVQACAARPVLPRRCLPGADARAPGLGMGLKEECTSVSSRSSTKVFLLWSSSRFGPSTASLCSLGGSSGTSRPGRSPSFGPLTYVPGVKHPQSSDLKRDFHDSCPTCGGFCATRNGASGRYASRVVTYDRGTTHQRIGESAGAEPPEPQPHRQLQSQHKAGPGCGQGGPLTQRA